MAPIFEDFPYTNFHELNIDWLLEVIKDLDERVTALENASNASASTLASSLSAVNTNEEEYVDELI